MHPLITMERWRRRWWSPVRAALRVEERGGGEWKREKGLAKGKEGNGRVVMGGEEEERGARWGKKEREKECGRNNKG